MADVPSIAILPFDNLIPGGEEDYLIEGLVEELIHHLSRLPDLRVLARASTLRARNLGMGNAELRASLGVSHVLSGSVRAHGSSIRVNTQLTETAEGYVIASERFDKAKTDLLSLQDALAHTISDHLKLQLLPSKHRQGDLEGQAYQLYLKGRHLQNANSAEAMRDAIPLFVQSSTLAPDFAPAYAALSRCYAFLALRMNMDHDEGMARARAAAFRAIELDPRLEEAHLSLGEVYLYAWEWKKAAKSLRLALELNPGNALVHRAYARYLVYVLEPQQAIKELELALRLDPLSVEIKYGLADVLMIDGQLELAIQICREILELYPENRVAMNTMGYCMVLLDRFEEAEEVFKQVYELLGRGNRGLTSLAILWAKRGEVERTLKAIQVLNERMIEESEPGLHLDIALLHLFLGRREVSMDHLRKLLNRRHGMLPFLHRHPAWADFHGDPTWQSLMAETGLLAHLEERKSGPSEFVRTLKSDTSERITLDLSDLVLVQALDNYARVVWTERGQTRHKTLRISLKSLLAQVEAPFVLRCHKSFLVNSRHPFHLKGNAKSLKLHSSCWSEPIPVSRSLIKEVAALFPKS